MLALGVGSLLVTFQGFLPPGCWAPPSLVIPMEGDLSTTTKCQDLVERIQALTLLLGLSVSWPGLVGFALNQTPPRVSSLMADR